MITAAAATRGDLIAVTFDDGRPAMQVPADWPELVEWVAGEGEITPYVPPPAMLAPYQAARKAAYIDLDVALEKRPEGASGSAENTNGHVIDATLTMLETLRVAAGVPATAEWAALVAAVTAIKIANPKPD